MIKLQTMARSHPTIACSIKTSHASRAVLNRERACIQKMLEEGLIESSDAEILIGIVEANMKRLLRHPLKVKPLHPMEILRGTRTLLRTPFHSDLRCFKGTRVHLETI